MEPTKTIDKEYVAWIAELSNGYRQSQIKAAVRVNAERLDVSNRQQLSDDFSVENRPQHVDVFKNVNGPQVVDDSEKTGKILSDLFSIPWSHHRFIIDKANGDSQKALFFVRKTIENNWGRGMLVNILSTDLYERQGAALTNFATSMPKPESDLAQEYFKDPYIFEYELARKELPDELRSKLPTEEEIEQGLNSNVSIKK